MEGFGLDERVGEKLKKNRLVLEAILPIKYKHLSFLFVNNGNINTFYNGNMEFCCSRIVGIMLIEICSQDSANNDVFEYFIAGILISENPHAERQMAVKPLQGSLKKI